MDSLANFREQIDLLDAQIIETLGRRFGICRKIAYFKKEHQIPTMQHSRVEEVKSRCANMGTQYGVSAELIIHIYDLIIQESCRIEDEIIGLDHGVGHPSKPYSQGEASNSLRT